MKEQESIEQENRLTEERLQYECEQAFLRRHFEAPSVEAEWKAFRKRTHRPRPLYRWVSMAAAAAVAVIALFLVMPDASSPTPDTLTLVTAHTEVDHPVIVEKSIASTDSVVHRVPVAAQQPIMNQGIVFSAGEADYTGSQTEHIRDNVVSIPYGQMYKITLNDGTVVWLNAGSRLMYPTRFTGTKRRVRLEGEAFFRVANNEQMPFVIETEKLTTQVLGTEFNVKAYRNSEAHVTLVSGSVKVKMPELGEEILLQPGEDMAYEENGFQVKKVDTSYYTQWLAGYFYFDDMHLTDILSDLGRWYNMTVEIECDSLLMSQRLHFVSERNEEIDRVVENLNAFEYLFVSKKENKLTVRRKK